MGIILQNSICFLDAHFNILEFSYPLSTVTTLPNYVNCSNSFNDYNIYIYICSNLWVCPQLLVSMCSPWFVLLTKHYLDDRIKERDGRRTGQKSNAHKKKINRKPSTKDAIWNTRSVTDTIKINIQETICECGVDFSGPGQRPKQAVVKTSSLQPPSPHNSLIPLPVS